VIIFKHKYPHEKIYWNLLIYANTGYGGDHQNLHDGSFIGGMGLGVG
jgi:hypothetical protein